MLLCPKGTFSCCAISWIKCFVHWHFTVAFKARIDEQGPTWHSQIHSLKSRHIIFSEGIRLLQNHIHDLPHKATWFALGKTRKNPTPLILGHTHDPAIAISDDLPLLQGTYGSKEIKEVQNENVKNRPSSINIA